MFTGGSQTLIKVAEKYEKQKQILMEAMQNKQASSLMHYNRDRRFSDVGLDPDFTNPRPVYSNPKSDRRHSDLTAYYYQHQLGTHLPYKNQTDHLYLNRQAPSKSANPNVIQFSPPKVESYHIQSKSSSAFANPLSVPEKHILTTETTYNTPKYLTHSEKTENISQNANFSPREDLKKSAEEKKKSNDVEDWSEEGDAVLENEEWCSFLDSQLEECLHHDNQVNTGLKQVLSLKECLRHDNQGKNKCLYM